MDNEAVIARIKQLIADNNLTQNDFADRICIDRSNLSKHLNGKLPISDSLVNKIVVNLGVSKRWLTHGESERQLYSPQPAGGKIISLPADAIHPIRGGGAKVYDIDVTAGPSGRDMLFASEDLIGSIDVPFIHPEANIVKVSGDSMFPVLKNGDMIAIRAVKNTRLIFWGEIYVVILEDYRMVKYIRKHDDPQMVILRSENKAYDDIEVYKNDIRSLFLVENVIRFDTRF